MPISANANQRLRVAICASGTRCEAFPKKVAGSGNDEDNWLASPNNRGSLSQHG
jgi:hypothetical protein